MKHLTIKSCCFVGLCVFLICNAGCSSNNMANPDTKENHSGKVYSSVQIMPSFPGGESALMHYLNEHIHYPPVARENGIQGTVVVQFVVNKDGSLSQVKTVGARKGGGLEEEAVRVVEGMPDWIAGKQDGQKVNVRFDLPVRYVLQ